jgi:uncharacterized protein
MAKLTQEMKDLVAQQQCFIATVNADGTPTLGPKRSTRVLDDEHLVFSEATGNRTWSNVQRGSKVAIAVVDREAMKGFRFEGTPEAITLGPAFDQAAEMLRQRGIQATLRAVVKVRVERIYNLGVPGAGDEIR